MGRVNGRIRALEKSLDLAQSTIARMQKARAAKIKPGRPRKRTRKDIVRVAFGDLHGCKLAPAAVAAMLGDIQELNPDEIVIGGDMVDCGGFLAQHHTLGYVAETEYSYEDDIETANGFLDNLRDAAPNARIDYLEGNHENRVERWIVTEALRNTKDSRFLKKLVAPKTLLHLEKRGIQYYARNEAHGDCRQPGFIRKGKCFFVHEISGSQNAATDALRKVAGNVVFFHTHRADTAIGFRPGIGDIGAWNPGCLCEPRPMWQHTRPNDWTHGYGVQLVAPSGNFLHINVPIIQGESLLIPFTDYE